MRRCLVMRSEPGERVLFLYAFIRHLQCLAHKVDTRATLNVRHDGRLCRRRRERRSRRTAHGCRMWSRAVRRWAASARALPTPHATLSRCVQNGKHTSALGRALLNAQVHQ